MGKGQYLQQIVLGKLDSNIEKKKLDHFFLRERVHNLGQWGAGAERGRGRERIFFLFLKIFFKIYLFIRQRQRQPARQGTQAGGWERKKQASSGRA